ncbi:MAG: hypothetical protein PHZ02_01640 [Desulfocapsaceae bacterium]|nr:hypothetical protein [Desulfocapsaceae bacterium]
MTSTIETLKQTPIKRPSKEFVEAFNKILKFQTVESYPDQDPFVVMGASVGAGWRTISLPAIYARVVRSTDGRKLAFSTWSEDDASTFVFEISPKINDDEIIGLAAAHFSYTFETIPTAIHHEETRGVTLSELKQYKVEMLEDGSIVKKEGRDKYRVAFKKIQFWPQFNSREEAVAYINDAIPRIRAAARRVISQEYKEFKLIEDAETFFKDKKIIDYLPFKVFNGKGPNCEWMYFEGKEGIIDLKWSWTCKHQISEWVLFWEGS